MKGHSFMTVLAAIILILSGCAQKEASAPTHSTDPTQAAAPAQAASGSKEIKVTAKNFEFEPGEVHVNKGDKVKNNF